MSVITAYIAIGSNIKPEDHVPEALKYLRKVAQVSGISTHYRTPPLKHEVSQEDYLNGVWRVETNLTPFELKDIFREMEKRSGRIRQNDSYAPRTLDLDLLMWADLVDSGLGIPDEDVLVRPFLFGPLIELDDRLIWPLTSRLLKDMVDISQLQLLRADEDMTLLLRGIINE